MDVKEAIDKAADYLVKFIPKVEGIRLEEVEITDDDKYYIITFSFDNPSDQGYLNLDRGRKYKSFKIDINSGELRSMKIRELK
ncbi:hypothetical protein BH23BAC1_BH23BAC1_48180 [soil metagenome]